jgi:hypothetical protein
MKCLNDIHICVCLWENRNKKYILSLSLELVNVGSYDFPHPSDALQNSQMALSRQLSDMHLKLEVIKIGTFVVAHCVKCKS